MSSLHCHTGFDGFITCSSVILLCFIVPFKYNNGEDLPVIWRQGSCTHNKGGGVYTTLHTALIAHTMCNPSGRALLLAIRISFEWL